MEFVISETLWELTQEIFKKKDTISSKLCVPGLIFLKYISHAYDTIIKGLKQESGDIKKNDFDTYYKPISDFYDIKNKVLIIPSTAHWEYILENADSGKIGTYLDYAMHSIEEMNKAFKSILPKEYSSPNINISKLSKFIKKLGEIPAYHPKVGTVLKHAYDYIVRKSLSIESSLPLKEIFLVPPGVEKLMVSMVSPLRGKIFDPFCGIGTLLVESLNLLKEKGKPLKQIKFYGQENRLTLFQLCCMNLAIHGIDIRNIKCHNDIAINNEIHNQLKADIILSAPPYNSRVFPWIYYVLAHLSREGCAAVLISEDSIFIDEGEKNRIHSELIQTNFVDCIVRLFPMAGISLSILILAMDRGLKNGGHRYRRDEILLIDLTALPSKKKGIKKELAIEDINEISSIYHKWRGKQGESIDTKGCCEILKIDT